MNRNPTIAAFLSLLVPGLGQVYVGRSAMGGAIIAAAIIIGNLNIAILPLIAIANPVIPAPPERALWAYWIPRVAHDVLALWSIVFWGWAVAHAYRAGASSTRPSPNQV